MTKSKKSLVTDPNQMSLFDLLRQDREERAASRPGRLDIRAQNIAAIKHAIRHAPKSRETIADEMTELSGERVTLSMINNWTSDSHPHEMPARFYPAFCVATGNNDLVRIQAESVGIFTLPGPDALRAEIRRYEESERDARREKRKREILLQELETSR